MATLDNLIVLGYDLVGNLTSVADDDSELAFSHDGLNRVLTAATGAGGVQPLVTLTNAFDAVGNRISLTDDGGLAGAVTGYAFDDAGRLTQLTTPAGQLIGLGYDPAGRVTGMTFPNTVSSTVSYELATGRLSQLTHTAGAVPLADFGYGYNDLGNVTQIAELGQTRDFAYDDLQRLTAGGTVATPESYAYDEEGNRTTSHLSAAHTTDIANRLTEDDQFTYLYDANGNLTSKTDKATLDTTGYTYDAQNQLTRIDFPDLSFAAYRYDGLGRRIEKDVNGALTQYVYDGSAILLEYDGLENLLARYSHGQQIDQPLAVERGGQSYYYQADHQGSLRKITDSAGAVVNAYDYDSYGRIEASFEAITNPFTYTGREFDAESGLYYYRARYYDAQEGRFLAEDPIGFGGGDANLYRYVSNNPVNSTDPSGLFLAYCMRNPFRTGCRGGGDFATNFLGGGGGGVARAKPSTRPAPVPVPIPIPVPDPEPRGGGDDDDGKIIPFPTPDPGDTCDDPGDNEGDPDGGGDGDGDDGDDGNNFCKNEQDRLISNRGYILLLLKLNMEPAVAARQYNNAARSFNVSVDTHNRNCPQRYHVSRLRPLRIGPQADPYAYPDPFTFE